MVDFMIGGRKLVMAVLVLLAGLVLVYVGVIPATQASGFLTSVLGLYVAGNLGEHAANAVNTLNSTCEAVDVEEVTPPVA